MAIARLKQAVYVNTTPAATASYNIAGKGVADATIAYNPQTTTEQDVVSATANTDLTGYQPTLPMSQKFAADDPVYLFIDGLRMNRSVLADAETDIILVDTFKTAVSGAYPAEKQKVSVQVDDYGGAASDPLTISYTFNFKGDAVKGTFNPTTKAFTAA
jgi:hypothetical protein